MCVVINMKNVTSSIIGINQTIQKELLKKLSYVEGGFGVKPSVKTLFNTTNNVTYTGLIPHVLSVLRKFNIEYKINDLREVPEKNANFKMNEIFQARDYQEKIISNVSTRDIIQAATGAGKTFIMASLIAKHNVKPAVVIAPSISLAIQIKDEFEKFLNTKVGICGGGKKVIHDITVSTPESAPDDLLKECKMILWDECLRYNQKILMADGSYKKIGDLVKNKSNEYVMSYNHKTNKLEPKKIIGHSKTKTNRQNKKLMRIKIKKSNGKYEFIECTENHKIWVESLNKYVYARDLVKGHKVKALSNSIPNKD